MVGLIGFLSHDRVAVDTSAAVLGPDLPRLLAVVLGDLAVLGALGQPLVPGVFRPLGGRDIAALGDLLGKLGQLPGQSAKDALTGDMLQSLEDGALIGAGFGQVADCRALEVDRCHCLLSAAERRSWRRLATRICPSVLPIASATCRRVFPVASSAAIRSSACCW